MSAPANPLIASGVGCCSSVAVADPIGSAGAQGAAQPITLRGRKLPLSKGRITSLKRGYGWDRTRLDGGEGARIWTGYGILAHNLVKIGNLASAVQPKAQPGSPQRSAT